MPTSSCRDRTVVRLKPTGKCLFHLAGLPFNGSFKGLDCARPIVMQDPIELLGQLSVKIMTDQFRIWPVNHADRALQSFLAQSCGQPAVVAQIQKEIRDVEFVKEALVTFRMCGADDFAFCGCVPFGCSGNRTIVSGETDRDRLSAKVFPDQLPEIQLTAPAHLGRARVTQMRIMRPDDDFGGSIRFAQVIR